MNAILGSTDTLCPCPLAAAIRHGAEGTNGRIRQNSAAMGQALATPEEWEQTCARIL
jgi:hypothetical protein